MKDIPQVPQVQKPVVYGPSPGYCMSRRVDSVLDPQLRCAISVSLRYNIVQISYSRMDMSGRRSGSNNVLLTKRDRLTMLRDLKAKALAGDSSAAAAAGS